MTEFDDFLQKTERALEARRAAMAQLAGPPGSATPAKGEEEHLQRLASLEWPRLLLAITDQTSGKSINKDRFLAYGRTGVMLGKFVLVLKPANDRENSLKYLAEYRTSSPNGGVIKLAGVTIEPKSSKQPLGRRYIAWQSVGLDHSGQLATAELATVLAIKLVDLYQANAI